LNTIGDPHPLKVSPFIEWTIDLVTRLVSRYGHTLGKYGLDLTLSRDWEA